MGLGSSKKASSSSSSSVTSDSSGHGLGEKNENRRRKRGRIIFTSPCFGIDHQFKRKGVNSKSKHSHCVVDEEEKPNSKQSEKLASSSSSSSSQIPEFHTTNSELSEENRESTSQENPTTTCPGTSTTINADNNSKRRFKLNRALSLGSSLSHNLLSNDDNNTNTSINENITQQDPNSETRRNNLVESERNAQRNRDVLENSVRFSRTLSVGRLRDRVLRRPPFPEGLFSPVLLDETAVNTRRVLRRAGSLSNNISDLNSDNDNENHGELFERRRRIRSQVRALQRLGSRFENLTGHERSCVLSGRHRTDRCTCRARNQDETSTRSSISRIVMLAEALFEVLDEIQQQSVVISSSRRPFSTVGSVPAPKEIVESLPVKFYEKNPKNNDEICQCYICLVEYEEGDGMRVLPCNHEFHLTCIDKWLKEIHRVCPLCRGDVCKA